MIEAGIYMSGTPPYGYTNVKTGIFSKRGIERKKLAILQKEAEVVKLVYRLSTENGWGGHRIAKYLNERNIPTKKNSKWTVSVVNFMLRNPIYKGYLTYNKTSVKKNGTQGRVGSKEWVLSDKPIEEIIIIDEKEWEKSQKVRESRIPEMYKEKNMDYESYPLHTKSDALFTGFIKCGYCGSKMNGSSSRDRYKTKEGTIKYGKQQKYYRCVSRISNGGATCNQSKSCYRRGPIEEMVLEEIFTYFDTLEKVDLTKKINDINNKSKSEEEIKIKDLSNKITKVTHEFETLKKEIVKSINGSSSFTPEILSELINTKEKELLALREESYKLNEQIKKQKYDYNSMMKMKELIPIWKDEFQKSSIEMKKMLLAQIIDEILIYREKIEIKLKIIMEEFLKYAKELKVDDIKSKKIIADYCKNGYIGL
ncbi:MAG: recombinase family protein [Clostridia bacterium]|nr:recombinase family protein [Clostridia bacterium]